MKSIFTLFILVVLLAVQGSAQPCTQVTQPSSQTLCNGQASTAVNFSGGAAGTVYNWSAVMTPQIDQSNSSVGVGTGACTEIWQSFTAGISGNLSQVSMEIDNSTASGTLSIYSGSGTGGTLLYSTPFSVSTSAWGNLFYFPTNFVPVTAGQQYTMAFVCSSGTIWSGYNNPVYPGGSLYTTQIGQAVQGAAVVFQTYVAPTIGLAASGTGDIPSFTVVTSAPSNVTATVTVTPSLNGCNGTPQTFTITVAPLSQINQPANQDVCPGTTTAPVNFSGGVTGTTYSWTNDNTSIGLGASGTGNIPSFISVNNSTSPVTATITVSQSANACNSTLQKTFTITVNPSTQVIQPENQTVCPGTATAPVIFSGGVSGTTYSWTNNNTSIGLAASGNGDIGSINAVNNTTSPETATITVTPITYLPSAVGCSGTAKSFTIIVTAPNTQVTQPASQTLCNGQATTAVNFSGGAAGTVYNWSTVMSPQFIDQSNSSVGVGTGACNKIWQSFTAGLSGNLSQVAMEIDNSTASGTLSIYSGSGTGGTLLYSTPFSVSTSAWGNLFYFPTNFVPVTAGQQYTMAFVCSSGTIWSGYNNPVYPGGSLYTTQIGQAVQGAAVVFQTYVAPTIGLAASGTGDIPSFTAVNNTSSPVTATVTVTPSLNGCNGTPQTFTIAVNVPPVAAITSASTSICSGATTMISGTITATGAWTLALIDGTTATGTGSGTWSASVSPISNKTYTISTLTDAGCSAILSGLTGSEDVTVKALPTAGINTPSSTVLNCTTTSISLTATGGGTYSWSDGTSVIGTSATLLVTTPGTYTVTVTSANGCSATATQVITQDVSLPTAGINTPSSTVLNCTTTSISLTATGGGTYSWSDGTSVVGTSATLLVTTAGTYTVTVTSANGCTATATQVITQDVSLPTAGINTPSSTVLNCTTTSISLTATGGGTYSWSDGTSVIGTSATLLVTTAGTYTVTVTSANGCSATATQVITQDVSLPTAGINTPSSTVLNCTTTSISLTATGGGTYSWSDGTSVVGTSATLLVTTAGTYTVTVTSANGCSATATQVITQDVSLPTAGINTPSTTVLTCSTTSIALTATGGGTYSWSDGINNLGTSATINVTTAGNYTVTVTGTNGCSATASQQITQNNTVPAAPVVTTPVTYCQNATAVQLTATGTNLLWYTAGTGGTGSVSAPTPSTTTTGTTSYWVTQTNGSGCESPRAQIDVVVNVLPNAVATPSSQAICSGTSITPISLTGGVSGTTFNWTRDNTGVTGIASSGSGNISGALTNTTNAAVTVTFTITPSANSCVGTPITATVTVNPSPNATIAVIPLSLCSGAAGNTASVASGATSYLWKISNGTITGGSGTNSITYTANMYDVKLSVTVTNGCGTASSTIRILINQLPTVSSISGKSTVIKSSSITLSNATSGGVWSSGNTSIATVSTGGVVTGVSAGSCTISYTVTNLTTGCSNKATKAITVYNQLAATAATGTILCSGTTTTITVSATGGSGGYQYSLNSGKSQSSNKFTVGAGTYSVTVTDNIGDKVTISGITITQPTALALKLVSETNASSKTATNGSFTVSGSGGGFPYLYSKNGGSTFQSSGTFGSLAPGTYKVSIKDANNCVALNKLSVTVGYGSHLSLSTGAMPQINNGDEIVATVSPNPTETEFTLTLSGNSNKPVELRVIDMYGRSVYYERGSANQSYKFGQRFTGGVYVVEILQGNLVKTLKLVKAK